MRQLCDLDIAGAKTSPNSVWRISSTSVHLTAFWDYSGQFRVEEQTQECLNIFKDHKYIK